VLPLSSLTPHRRRKHQEEQEKSEKTPEIHLDYCFQRKDEEAKPIATLVMREKPSGSTASIVAPAKGRDEYVIRRILAKVKQWGDMKVKLIARSDGENFIKALVRTVQIAREKECAVKTGGTHGGTVVEGAPKNDSASSGS
jgi:hypothetical protein